jgi:hypothetical protein
MNDIGHDDDLSDEERRMLRSLPREMVPPAVLEERVVEAMKGEGLLRAPETGRNWPRTLRRMGWVAATAAGLALFASGMVVGQWNATRAVATAMARSRGGDAVTQAARVQEAGSDYVRAVAHLADLAAQGDDRAVAPGREAARVALHAAALELARLTPDDATLRLVLAVLEDRMRGGTAADSGAARTTIWF